MYDEVEINFRNQCQRLDEFRSNMFSCKSIFRILRLCFLCILPVTTCQKIHELMTADEVYRVFRTIPEAIPNYEVVPIIHSLYKRSTPTDFRLKFTAFNKEIDTYLNPNDGILVGEKTPVWIAERSFGETKYRKLDEGIMNEVLGVYQNVGDQAALVVRGRRSNKLTFEGTIDDLTLTPLPKRLQTHVNKQKRDLPVTDRTMTITEHHVIFKSNTRVNNTHKSEQFVNQTVDSRLKRSVNDVIFPTILVTTDFNEPIKSQNDSQFYDQLIYQLAFWNAVDLRYRHLNNPKVRLRIAGFIIGADRKATSYLNRHTINGEVEIYPAIDSMRSYWYQMTKTRDFPSEAYHVVMTATNLKLFSKDSAGKTTHYGGLTRISSFCQPDWDDKFYPSVIFHDDRGFGQINVAVHELAHILGAYHDKETEGECTDSNGYLMSSITSTTINNPTWSKCSLEKLSIFLRTKDCANKPREHYPAGNPVSKILPGTLKTTHEQCQARGFDWACETTPDICKVLRCYYTGWSGFFTTLLKCQNSQSAAEGTPCAPDRICLDRECRSPS